MIISEIDDEVGLLALGPEWSALHTVAGATPFQSWEWMTSWWRHGGSGRLWVLVARNGDGALVGLLPLVRVWYRGLPLRRVSFLGTPISDYHTVLAVPEHADACARAFIAHLLARSASWDVVDLPDLPEDSPLVRARPEEAQVVPHRICPVIALEANWDAQRARLGKNLRGRVDQKRRRLERDFQVSFDVVGEDEVSAALDDLFWLHNQRWRRRGLRGAFADARVRRFHQEVAPRLLGRGWLRLHRLRLDGKTRALFYCLAYGDHVYYYLSGFDLAFQRHSLGTVLMAEAVRGAIAARASVFDLLRGDENYKREWRAQETRTVRMLISRPRCVRARLALGVNWLERRLDVVGSRLRNRLWGRHA